MCKLSVLTVSLTTRFSRYVYALLRAKLKFVCFLPVLQLTLVSSLQQQLKSERDHFKRQNERIQRSLEKERVELDDEKQTFAQQKSSLKVEWDALHKARDDYQRDLARLRELQRKTQHDLHPSSSSSSVSSLGNKNSNNNIPDSVDLKVPDGKGSRSYSSLQAASGDSKPQISPTYASSSEYPRTFPGSKKESSSVANPVSSHQQLPIHLQFSATNQIAAMQVKRVFRAYSLWLQQALVIVSKSLFAPMST